MTHSTTTTTAATDPAAATPMLSVRDLEVRYGGLPVVHGVDLEVHAGEILGLIGESGSGKSTVGRAMLGLLPAGGRVSRGRIHVGTPDGPTDLVSASTRERRGQLGRTLGLIPQGANASLNPVMTCLQHFRVVLRNRGIRDRAQIRERATSSLLRAGIHDPERVLELYAHEMSGGMAQRVVVGLAIVTNPSVLIADEPTSALDVTVQRKLLDNLTRMVHEEGTACLLISHDLGLMAHYCQRLLVLYHGVVVESGPAAEVLHRPVHPFTARLVASVPGARSRAAHAYRAPGAGADQVCPNQAWCAQPDHATCGERRLPLREVGSRHHARTSPQEDR
ncbi:ABC transporter ATP-binding protein [Nocardia jinanensis]|uniref:ABC transporter domain-containing protein n=1 Tax=Nocardia jinanensis TaxID=382504 RepID=A0A917RC70_9NOCA|nr:ABC transporter ATP-binding protein [Nocardia jinanensis]GGK99060.1 hypothetical protein GCM10011588_12100 [Nocardia jinanensis]